MCLIVVEEGLIYFPDFPGVPVASVVRHFCNPVFLPIYTVHSFYCFYFRQNNCRVSFLCEKIYLGDTVTIVKCYGIISSDFQIKHGNEYLCKHGNEYLLVRTTRQNEKVDNRQIS